MRRAYHGVMPAVPTPLGPDQAPDLDAFGRLVDRLAGTDGVTGFLINGHAGENATLPLEDQRKVMAAAAEANRDRALLIAGVNVPASAAAARHARALEDAGADALMVFPPDGWALAASHESVMDHHRAIIDATGCDICLFQASVAAGRMAFARETLAALAVLPRVKAVKEGSWEVAAYEANRRVVKAVAPDVAVMGSGDEHLFTSAVVGSEGAIVSLAAVVPQPIVALLGAVERGDLAAAREAHERIYPIAKAVYGDPPPGMATARLKTLLMFDGHFASDRTVPPAPATAASEHEGLRAVLAHAQSLSAP